MAKKYSREPLSKEEKRPVNRKTLAELYELFKYILPYKYIFIFGLMCLLASSITTLAFPHASGMLADAAAGTQEGGKEAINQIVLFLFFIFVINAVLSFFRVYLFAQVSERAMADLRKDLYSKYMGLSIPFFDKHRNGELMSRITSDISTLQDTFSTSLAEFIRQFMTLLIGVAIIFWTSPKLALFMVSVFPVLVVIMIVFGKFIRKLSKKVQDKLAEANTVVEETLQSVTMVKAFTNEKYEVKRYNKMLQEVVKYALHAASYRGAFISFIFLGVFGGIIVVMWYGARLVVAGDMSIGGLISFLFYTIFIGASVGGLGEIFGQIQRAIGASERVREILNLAPESTGHSEEKILLKGNIEFKAVGFAYPTRKEVEVLKGINLSIRSGERVALVGHSGAGKSTITSLLMRFYEPDSGQISIDGKTISSYPLTSYRKNIGIVPQEVILFGGTIKENIAYGKPNASLEEIIDAARKANAYQFIQSFPEGMETLVGERGIKLSGGQRQRIAIARAILKDPSILILDEATSSLDAESERLVQDALEKLMKNRTSIVIAHRLATIRKVDKIYVVGEGGIIESGTHEELAHIEGGIYSNLVRLQMEVE